MKRFNQHVATGTANGVSNSTVAGNALFLGKNTQKVADLSALVTVLAETNGLTMTPRWRVSNDNSTYYTLPTNANNPASVAIATGTAGADAATSVAVPAPAAALSYQFAKLELSIGGATGTTLDTFSIGYTYRVPRGQARRN